MNLLRNYYKIDYVKWGEKSQLENGILIINKEKLKKIIKPYMESIKNIDFSIVKPDEDARIIHVLDTIQPMYKKEKNIKQYSGFFSHPETLGMGETNMLEGFTVMQSASLPWDSESTSSGLLYPREAIIDMNGQNSGYNPFSEKINLVMNYDLKAGKSSEEYDKDIRLSSLKVANYLATLTEGKKPDYTNNYSIEKQNKNLPNVVLVWQVQNQGTYANTFLYGKSIDNLVPTLLHPNELLDGCLVSGNYVWPAFKVPTYLHVNHPILLELYKKHGSEINFKGVIFSRSHNPTHWEKERSANVCVKLAKYLEADGLVMAWEGGGNAATDGMLTIQEAERNNISTSTITFEFGGGDGTEGSLLVDDVPEADAIVSGGSIEKEVILPEASRVIGGKKLRLDKESGGYFPFADKKRKLDNTTLIYCAGNQSGHSKLFSEAY